jgi:hypothetical protein
MDEHPTSGGIRGAVHRTLRSVASGLDAIIYGCFRKLEFQAQRSSSETLLKRSAQSAIGKNTFFPIRQLRIKEIVIDASTTQAA